MRKRPHSSEQEMPEEIDFSRAGRPVVGKYYARATQQSADELRPEYRPEDFAGLRAVRGKYAEALRRSRKEKMRKMKSTRRKRAAR
jgi:ABC-type transporter MlaC component